MKTNSATVRAAFGRRLRLEPLESRALLATASPLVLDAFFAGGFITPSGWLTEMAVQGDGKVVAAGYAEEAPQGLLLKRFSADGAADLSFGEAGVVRLLNAGWASAVVIQNDGRIIVAAGSTLHRFDTVGQLDLTFGQGGRAELGIPQPPFRDIEDLALQSDGKIVALRSDFRVARFNPNGTLDGSFATGGVTPELFANSHGERLLVAPDGRIVICGTTMPGNESSQIVVAQLTSAGLLDKSFRGSGKSAIEIAGGHDSGLAMALQSDGKILIGGMTSPLKAAQVKRDLALARLLPNGLPDPTFGMQGVVVHPLSDGDDRAAAIAIQPNGKIVVATSAGQPGLARFLPDGRLESTHFLSAGGTTDNGALAFDPAGTVVALWSNAYRSTPHIARYLPDPQPVTGELGGMIWNDYNANGVRDQFEAATAGVVAFLDLDRDATLDDDEPTCQTDVNGVFRFNYLTPGAYLVRTVAPEGYVAVTPPRDGGVEMTVAAGDVYQPSVLDFEDLAHSGSVANHFAYRCNGFSVSNTLGVSNSKRWDVYGPALDVYLNSAALAINGYSSTISIVRDDGRPFNLCSIDFSRWRSTSSAGSLELVGTRTDGTTVSQAVTLSRFGLSRVALEDFTDVVRVEWRTYSLESLHQFDNVRFDVRDAALSPSADFGFRLPADFDGDRAVTAGDLDQWMASFGLDSAADADLDGDSDGADFLAWQRTLAAPAADAFLTESQTSLAAVSDGSPIAKRQIARSLYLCASSPNFDSAHRRAGAGNARRSASNLAAEVPMSTALGRPAQRLAELSTADAASPQVNATCTSSPASEGGWPNFADAASFLRLERKIIAGW